MRNQTSQDHRIGKILPGYFLSVPLRTFARVSSEAPESIKIFLRWFPWRAPAYLCPILIGRDFCEPAVY